MIVSSLHLRLRILSPEIDVSSEEQETTTNSIADNQETKGNATRASPNSPSSETASSTASCLTPIDTPRDQPATPVRHSSQHLGIDMGMLVRLGDGKNKDDAIPLYMPDDGRQTVLLRVGKFEEGNIRIQGQGIGKSWSSSTGPSNYFECL